VRGRGPPGGGPSASPPGAALARAGGTGQLASPTTHYRSPVAVVGMILLVQGVAVDTIGAAAS
jgi:hypothetical protein